MAAPTQQRPTGVVQEEHFSLSDEDLPPQKAASREPARRHDSDLAVYAPLDGWGDPLKVECDPGLEALWTTDSALEKYMGRPWQAATWGMVGVRVPSLAPDDKGKPIRYRELRLYVMRTSDAERMRERDPYRVRHNVLRGRLFEAPPNAGDRGTEVKEYSRDVTI
jgi:hypothetical protein